MKRTYFGTDGVRGPYGGPVINEDFAWRLGAAAARWLQETGAGTEPAVFIGRDTRASGPALTQALADGLLHGGCRPASLGVIPTPAVSLAVRNGRAALGVVVTASHNPAGDNGIKFFGVEGRKLSDAEEARIEALLPDRRGEGPAGPCPVVDGSAAYLESLKPLLAGRLDGWKIVLDTAHGATVQTSGRALRGLGATVVAIGDAPDGHNINEGVGSEHPERLSAAVRDHGARLGIAHDGDGDRCVLCDETGGVLDGDEILTILALQALAQGRLAENLLVVTQQSNLGIEVALAAAGGRVARTAIGDRYVTECMRAEGALLGGESSGHIICAEVSPTGDGLVAALKVIGVMRETGRPLSALRRALIKFPQLTRALPVRVKKPLETLPALTKAREELAAALGREGRVLVRYSGTEPKLRLLVEGPTQAVVVAGLDRLEASARAELEVL